MSGTPVRERERQYENIPIRMGLTGRKKTILICGGSQGAQSMNVCLIGPVQHWLTQVFRWFGRRVMQGMRKW